MYETHFKFTRRPFSRTPDPSFLYEGEVHAEALARLEMACDEGDIALLSGEVGAGKTTLSRALVDRLPPRFRVALIMNPRLSVTQLLSTIAERLDVAPLPKQKHLLLDALTKRLYECYQQGLKPLVIVDEAQLISNKSIFEELRLLTNIQLDDVPLIGLLIIGQPEIRQKLAKPSYESFAQRIGVAFHLGPLSETECARYIRHRVQKAGGTRQIFSDASCQAIARASFGVPRRINLLCQNALLIAYGEQSESVELEHVENVINDLKTHLGPMFAKPRGPTSSKKRGGGDAWIS